jgi:hypothetical protein
MRTYRLCIYANIRQSRIGHGPMSEGFFKKLAWDSSRILLGFFWGSIGIFLGGVRDWPREFQVFPTRWVRGTGWLQTKLWE